MCWWDVKPYSINQPLKMQFSWYLGFTAKSHRQFYKRLPQATACMCAIQWQKVWIYDVVCPLNAWIVTRWKKNLSRFLYHTKDHLAWLSEKKNSWSGATLLPEILGQPPPPPPLEWNRLFWTDICTSAVTPSEKNSINTNRKFARCFPMSPRWTLYVVPKPQKGGLKNAVSKIWTISCDNSETVRDRMSVTVNH